MRGGKSSPATSNRIFTPQRRFQIIVIVSAVVIMKLLGRTSSIASLRGFGRRGPDTLRLKLRILPGSRLGLRGARYCSSAFYGY